MFLSRNALGRNRLSVEQLLRVHEAQLLTCMRLSGKRLGLLFDFNVAHFRDAIQRKVL